MKEFNVGDRVWAARLSQEQVSVLCPVCFGKLKVAVILGDDSQVTVDCDYCSKGWEGPRGYTMEYVQKDEPKMYTLTHKETKNDGVKTTFTYHSGCYYFDSEGELLFETKEEASARCVALLAERAHEQDTRAEYIKGDKLKSFSWNVGYHMRHVKDCEKQAAYHREKAQLCRERSKKEA